MAALRLVRASSAALRRVLAVSTASFPLTQQQPRRTIANALLHRRFAVAETQQGLAVRHFSSSTSDDEVRAWHVSRAWCV